MSDRSPAPPQRQRQAPHAKKQRTAQKKKEKPLTPLDLLKLEIASELGLAEKVREVGWGGLTAAETGRVGGILQKRLKDLAAASGGNPPQ